MSAIIVLDVGKTQAKASLWTRGGELIDRRVRPNALPAASTLPMLDAIGIEVWLEDCLSAFAKQAHVGAIVPIAHGAAAALVANGRLRLAPDYEMPAPPNERAVYDAQRDDFAETGSPALPNGLNLGFQLHLLEAMDATTLKDAAIIPWPQYWSWLLSGVAASEVSSLGCHTDLWRPKANAPSQLAVQRGWAAKLPPLRSAKDILGPLRADWAARTGLPKDTLVYCGMHDSNAALHSMRAHARLRDGETTVLSTGTWFVAMRAPARTSPMDFRLLSSGRDCLINVDVEGREIPSARFMGGREIDVLLESSAQGLDGASNQAAMLAAIPRVIETGAMVMPSLVPGVGPFPGAEGGWMHEPADPIVKGAAIGLYAALMTDVMLSLVGARGQIVIEGRFSRAEVFVRALACLRPQSNVFVVDGEQDASYGALRLVNQDLRPSFDLRHVAPMEMDLEGYRAAWAKIVEQRSS